MKSLQLLLIAMLFTSTTTFAQVTESEETTQDKIDTLYNRTESHGHDIEVMKKFKWSGYLQAQWQKGDTAGINPLGGGSFTQDQDNRFTLRRGRLKGMYDNLDVEGNINSQVVFQVDFSERGFFIRDFYGLMMDHKYHMFGIKAGIMDKPFGYEVTLSSQTRETPERGRMSQTIFPNEKDMGIQFVISAPKNSRWNWFKLETGIYNGTGVANTSASLGLPGDFDSKKDWITRLSLFKANNDETIKFSGGISYLLGGHKNGTKYNYELGTLSNGNHSYILQDSNTSNLTAISKAQFLGADFQVSKDWVIGLTTFRAEGIFGTQPGTPTSSTTPNVAPTTNTYSRKFSGNYFYLIQNIAGTKHNVIFKYDQYDPNTKVKGTEIGAAGSNLTSADVKYHTFGMGYTYAYDATWRFSIYRDIIRNEITSLTGYKADRKDGVTTLRIQYNFKNF